MKGRNAYGEGQADAVALGMMGSDYVADTKIHHAGGDAADNDASNTYHPGVERWVAVKAVDADATFGAGSEAELGDAPQSGETIVLGDPFVGPLTKVQLSGGKTRLIRG